MTRIDLHEGDNREALRQLIDQGIRVHSVVTDPPYGLVSVTKRFGGPKAAPAKFGTDGAFARASAGFMGSRWDGTGIERDPEFWALVWEILLPGGYCVAFSGARTGHWQACAMEQAGFIMHPMLGWVFGQGFPKAHNAAKAIDKKLGHQGGVIPTGDAVRRGSSGAQQNEAGDWTKTDEREYQPGTYVPATEQATQWQGWAYGAQSLKPALEPIYVAQKPFSEKDGVLNLLKHGVGALNIDGCRVAPTGEVMNVPQSDPHKRAAGAGEYCIATRDTERMHEAQRASIERTQTLGRHPANLVHDGSAEVVALFPHQSGGGQPKRRSVDGERNTYGAYAGGEAGTGVPASSGNAARFFNAFPLDANPIRYQAKASRADRAGSKHPTVKPVALIEWLITLVTPPGGVVLDPFAGSGTTGQAARNLGFDCILMEAEDQFAADIRRRFDLLGEYPLPLELDPTLAALFGLHDPVSALVG